MKKYILDLKVVSVTQIHARYVLIRLTDDNPLPEMLPGQFVEVRVDGSASTFLRRPISINYVDRTLNELWLLVATVGDGTRKLATLQAGDTLNCVLPLGNGFTPAKTGEKVLLIGGGVGVAPLLYMGAAMKLAGIEPTFLLGARTAQDLLLTDEFNKYGRVYVTTEDGSEGEKGFVTNHHILTQPRALPVRLRWKTSWPVGLGPVSVVWRRPLTAMCVYARMDRCLISKACFGTN